MPEVILPCPACGSDVKISGGDEWHNQHSFFIECQCGVCRVGDTVRAECIDRWNAMPRALRWTHEPPKVAGWYWYQLDGHAAEPRKIDSSFDGEEYLGVRDGWYVNRITKKPHVKWAGPIPAPID